MKKIFLCLGILFVCGFAFGEVFQNSEKLVETFFAKGQCLKINEDENTIFYISRNCIDEIDLNETEMVVTTRLLNIHIIGVPEEDNKYRYEQLFNRIRTGNLPLHKRYKPTDSRE